MNSRRFIMSASVLSIDLLGDHAEFTTYLIGWCELGDVGLKVSALCLSPEVWSEA
jgi:hypothetical protein